MSSLMQSIEAAPLPASGLNMPQMHDAPDLCARRWVCSCAEMTIFDTFPDEVGRRHPVSAHGCYFEISIIREKLVCRLSPTLPGTMEPYEV